MPIGIPDMEEYGDLSKLPVKELVDYVLQKHHVRSGIHHDLRFGTPDTGHFSWAVRKGLPKPGQKHLAIQTQLHDPEYAKFEGRIEEGYGKGEVKREDAGKVLITKANSNSVHFTTASNATPERFVLLRTGMGKDGKGWLLLNTTPTKMLPQEKKRYIPVSAERAEEIISNLQPGSSVSPKIDGASNLYHLLKDKIDVISFRQSKRTGGPIFHTERTSLSTTPYEQELPKGLEGSVLRGELYGKDKSDKVIPAQALGGLLNSSIAKSLTDQKQKGIKLKSMLFDIDQLGKQKIEHDKVPYLDRYKLLESITKYLPKEKTELAPQITNSTDAMKLWKGIGAGENPLTSEGVVINRPFGNPQKAKYFEDRDVTIRKIFEGLGKYKGTGAGGFEYSLTPDSDIVGKTGTGFTDEVRKDMWASPEKYIGRTAKVYSHGMFPGTKALRVPVFHSLHEDVTQQDVPELGALKSKVANEIVYPDIQCLIKQAISYTPNELPGSEEVEGAEKKKNWVRHVMETSFATDPPKGIFTRSGQEIADVIDKEKQKIAPTLLSWHRMAIFHKNRGGTRLPEHQRNELSIAIKLMSQRLKERKTKPEEFDVKTLFPINGPAISQS